MLKNLSIFVGVGLIILILRNLLHIDLKSFVSDNGSKLIKYIGNINMRVHKTNMQKASISNKKTFVKSKLYTLINTMIFDLQWNGTTVEGFLFMLILSTVVINIVLYYYMRSTIIFLAGIPSIAVFIATIIFMMSSEGHFKREFAIMDSKDLLIVSMRDGMLHSVLGNLQLMSPIVQPMFKEFINDIQVYHMSMEEALDSLSKKLGPSFYGFRDKVKEFENSGRHGTLETFEDDMNENTARRVDMLDLQETLKQANIGYIAALCIIGVLSLLMLSGDEAMLRNLIHTPLGNIAIVINVVVIIGGFAYLQTLRN